VKTLSKTPNLYDVIHSELDLRGFNELENNGKWTFHDPSFSFMKKISDYDKDIQDIMEGLIFKGERLIDENADKHFKKTFLLHFLNKSINAQTIEDFSMKVRTTFLMNDEFINHIYDINSFLTNEQTSEQTGENDSITKGKTKNEQTGKNEGVNENRNARTDLPQSQVNVNLDDTELDYANEFNLSKSKDGATNENTSIGENENETIGKTKGNTISRQYSMDNLIKIKGLLESVFIEFEKNCFMQVF